jgi:hypothetical protein
MALDRIRVRRRELPLLRLVVEVRELKPGGLVDRPKVLVNQRPAELLDVDRPVDGLD